MIDQYMSIAKPWIMGCWQIHIEASFLFPTRKFSLFGSSVIFLSGRFVFVARLMRMGEIPRDRYDCVA